MRRIEHNGCEQRTYFFLEKIPHPMSLRLITIDVPEQLDTLGGQGGENLFIQHRILLHDQRLARGRDVGQAR